MHILSKELKKFIVFKGDYCDCINYLENSESDGHYAIIDIIKRKKCDKCFVIKMCDRQEPFFQLLTWISVTDSPFVVLKVQI